MKGIAFVIGLIALVAVSLFVYEANQSGEMSSEPTTFIPAAPSTITTITTISPTPLPPVVTTIVLSDGTTQTITHSPPPPSPQQDDPPSTTTTTTTEKDDGFLDRLSDLLGF